MKLIPLQDWAVIVPSEAEARTAGGLFIPDTAKEKPEEGVVEAIGPGALEEEKGARRRRKARSVNSFQRSLNRGTACCMNAGQARPIRSGLKREYWSGSEAFSVLSTDP